LKLVGTKANRPAIGARIKVTFQTPAGSRELHRVVSSGGSFGSNPLRQEIGLADATAITAVDIRWPGSNTRQTVTGLDLARGRDMGGVVRYLNWAGISDAADESKPFGINPDRAMAFYSNDKTRRFYRDHVQRIVGRRNTVTGLFYRDDPTIFGYELLNEAQSVTGRWSERRAWIAEMSAYLRSLDPDHLIASGDWGYRSAVERREWLADHALPNIDYCDVHLYPADDHDSFVDSPAALREFVDNRVAAALARTLIPTFGFLADRKLGEGLRVTAEVAEWAADRSGGFCEWLAHEPVPPMRRDRILAVLPWCAADPASTGTRPIQSP